MTSHLIAILIHTATDRWTLYQVSRSSFPLEVTAGGCPRATLRRSLTMWNDACRRKDRMKGWIAKRSVVGEYPAEKILICVASFTLRTARHRASNAIYACVLCESTSRIPRTEHHIRVCALLLSRDLSRVGSDRWQPLITPFPIPGSSRLFTLIIRHFINVAKVHTCLERGKKITRTYLFRASEK